MIEGSIDKNGNVSYTYVNNDTKEKYSDKEAIKLNSRDNEFI
jgi:hypothetical protein